VTAPRLLAIDVGTGSCRAVLFDETGRQLHIGQREYSHLELPGVPGSQVFDTEGVWPLICDCIREVLAAAGGQLELLGVSAASMREGMVLYDEGGREIWACPNVDSRAAAECAELVQSGLAEEIYARGGDWVAITAPARFRWIARHEPEVFARIAHVGMLADWVLYRLAGVFVTDRSVGSSSGMFDLAQGTWSDRIVEICELDRGAFPEVVSSGTVVGSVTSVAEEQTGLRAGTPVVAGGADTQLALVGIGVADSGRFTIVGGSFWQHTMTLDRPIIDPGGRLRTLCHSAPGQWMIEGIGFYSGLAMRWFRDAFCADVKLAAERDGQDVYDVLEGDAAVLPPGADGVVAILSNLMDAKRWVHAAPSFIGFDVARPQRSARAQCVRAIEECAAYVACGHMRIVEEITGERVRAVGFTGGAAKGRLWPRIVADVLGVEVSIAEVKESTALGAALYAGVGAGLYDDAGTAATASARVERTIAPDSDRHAAYEALYERWRELYAAQLQLSEQGVTTPLWRAAGT
jgi:autoinducer 2 (AI-2) kinase